MALALTDDHWQQSFDLNLFSAVRLDRGFLPSMLARAVASSYRASAITGSEYVIDGGTIPAVRNFACVRSPLATKEKRGTAMTMQLPQPPRPTSVRSINDHDPAAFVALFADAAVVNDVGPEFRGRAAIKAWSDREIFDAHVTPEVMDVAAHNGKTVVTTKVDGNFDRTGLPDPVIINHCITRLFDPNRTLT